MQSNQKIDIWLEKQSYRFRWKSEVKSNETTSDKIFSHGDYLRGRIKLPSNLNYSRYKLELCLVSSPDSDQNIFLVHPYLLHLTQPDTFLPLSDVNKESWCPIDPNCKRYLVVTMYKNIILDRLY